MARRIIPGAKDSQGHYVKAPSPVDLGAFTLSKFLFDKQLKFVEDPRPFKIAVCSRRSGKTVACAAHLIDTALKFPGTVSLYITLTRSSAKKIIWPEIQRINRNYMLGGVEDNTELSMVFPNGSMLYFSGAKDASEIEKFRGLALKLAYIDECQSFKTHIGELIDDVISPALMDYAGTLCLIGTPGPVPAGYFYDCAEKSDVWVKHAWTFFDNPYIASKSHKTHQEMLDRELKRRGVTAEDPSIQREYFGRWVLDADSLWVHYDPQINDYKDIPNHPAHKLNYIMGIDLGFEDADAIAVIAWSDAEPVTYLVEELIIKKQGLTPLVEQIKELQKKYDVGKMIIDEGGLGKKLAEEMRRQHSLPVHPADKARKQENVAFLNDALRTGKFKAKSTSDFAKDSYLVEIDWGKSRPDKIVLSTKYHSDIIDAVLYSFKESPTYAWEKQEKKPLYGSKEWAESQQSDMWEAAQDHFSKQADLEKKFNNYE